MCGICGKLYFQGISNSNELNSTLEGMTDALKHRGPDNYGYYSDGSVGLGFRRLSVIDLQTGDQPMANEDKSIWIVFNGEIYNYRDIRKNLIELGHNFRTLSDTEVIIHAYEEFGLNFVDYLRGMFALAIYDKQKNILVLARDRLGKKPLYFSITSETFVFASEIKALLRDAVIPREIDPQALDYYLSYKYIPAPLSIFKNIQKLPPGYIASLSIDTGELISNCYWSISFTPKHNLDFYDAASQVRQLLTESVELRLESDVPLGALLSGGIDSTIIVALMSMLSSKPVKTFTVGFNEQSYSEVESARLVAQRYETDHTELVVTPDSVSILPEIAYYLDEPMADISTIPTYYICRLARQSVTVVLNGDGGDESFAGYDSYQALWLGHLYKNLPTFIRRGLVEPLVSIIPNSHNQGSPIERARRLVSSAYLPLSDQFIRWMILFNSKDRNRLYPVGNLSPESIIPIQSEEYLRYLMNLPSSKKLNDLDILLFTDFQTYLPGDLLVKMDRMSMANSLEARSPLLDHKLVEWAAKIPSSYKMYKGYRKYILKKAFLDLIPDEIIKGRKHGFAVPIGTWLRQSLKDRSFDLLSSNSEISTFFQIKEIRKILEDHNRGYVDLGHQIWALLLLEEWLRMVRFS